MEGLINDYFCKPEAGQPFYQRGAIVWVPCAFLMEKFVRLKAEHYNPANQHHDYYTARVFPPDAILRQEQGLFHHLPGADQLLQKNEEFAVTRYKLRKAVICSTEISARLFSAEELRKLRVWFQDGFVVLPIYTLEDEQKNPKHPASFIARLKAYGYPQFFHLPRAEEFGMRESAMRFDRVQVVSKPYMKAAQVRLTDDVMLLVEEWLRFYLFGELDEENGLIALYRKEALAELDKQTAAAAKSK